MADLLKGIASGKYAYAIGLGADVEVDAKEAKAALQKLRGFVVIASHDGPLTQAAHVVLPATAWTEAEGTYVNEKGLAQVSEKALTPLGDARPGWQLVGELGKKLGFATGWKKLAEVRAAMPAELRAGKAHIHEAAPATAPSAGAAAG